MKKTKRSMRRFYAIVLCVSMIIGFLPISNPDNIKTAKAADKNMTSEVIFSGLNDYSSEVDLYDASFLFSEDEQLLYDQLVQAATDVMEGKYTDYEGEICVPYFSAPGIEKESAERVADAFRDETPLCFWLYSTTIGRTGDGYSVSFVIKDEYKQYDAMMAKWAQIKLEIEKYIQKAEGAPDDYTKAYVLYRELTSNNTYRYDSNGEPSVEPTAHSIEGIFLEHSAVCDGFSMAYALLLSIAGIPNVRILGWAQNGMGHAWNVVEIENQTYLCDATWDVEKTEDFEWFMLGKRANESHIWSKSEVTEQIPERYDYEQMDLAYCYLRNFDCNLQPNEGPVVTIPVMYDAENDDVRIYNNGIPVTIVNKEIKVVEGSILTIDAFNGDKAPNIGIMRDSQPIFYHDYYEVTNNDRIVIGFSNDEVMDVSDAYDIDLAHDGKTGTAHVDLILKSGRVLEGKTVTLTRNAASASAYIASSKFKDIVPDSVWCDRANFDYGMLAIDTVYDAEVEDLSSDITFDTSMKNYQITAKQQGYDGHIVYSNANGYEVRVFDMNGNRILSSGLLPVGKQVQIKLFDGKSEVPATFYCSTGDRTSPKQIDKDIFVTAGVSYITWEPNTLDNTLVSVEELTGSYDVENGLAPEEITAMVIPARTKIHLKDGRVMYADIDWDDFSAYDSSRKEEETVTVSGTIVLPTDIVNTDNVPTSVHAVLNVGKAEEVSFDEMRFREKIPTEIHVASGTPMTASEVGLTPVHLFRHTFTYIYNNVTRSYVKDLPLKLQWTYDAEAKKMIGVLDCDGYVCNDAPIEVSIIEEDGGITAPDASNYNINFTDANGQAIDGLYPRNSTSYKGLLSFAFPNAEQTEREIILNAPRGLKNVSVFNASLIEGVESAEVTTNTDGTSIITIKVDDDYDITKTLNVEFSYTPIYNMDNTRDNDFQSYDSKQDKRFDACADDFGMMYPIGDETPFRLSYKATENDRRGNVNLPISSRPVMKANTSFVSFYSSSRNDFKQTASNSEKIDSARISNLNTSSPYIISMIGVLPTPDIMTNTKNPVQAFRYGNRCYNTEIVSYTGLFANGKPDGVYSSKPAYAVCKDVFGQIYVVKSDKTTSVTISRAGNMYDSANVKDPYSWVGEKDESMFMHVYPKDGASVENVVEVLNARYYIDKEDGGSYVYGPYTARIEIPDGTMPAYFSASYNSTCVFVYTDGSTEELSKSEMLYEYFASTVYIDFKNTNTALSRGEKRVKEIIVTDPMNAWPDGSSEYPELVLAAYSTYSDGTPVALGSYLHYVNGKVKTNCPKVTGDITIENATTLFTKSYDAYLIGDGMANLCEAYFSNQDQSNVVYNYQNRKPRVSTVTYFGKNSFGDEDINNIKTVVNVADPELFHITGIEKYYNFDRISFYFTNGDVDTYTPYQINQMNKLYDETRSVAKIEIECDSTDFMKELMDAYLVLFNSEINFDRYIELYGKTQQHVKMLTGSVYIEGEKAIDLDDYYVDIKTTLQDYMEYGVYTADYLKSKYMPNVSYCTANNVSIESKLVQTDYAYVQWFMASYGYSNNVKHAGPYHLDSCTFLLTMDNGGEIDTSEECYLETAKYQYDEDGDGSYDTVIQEEGKRKPSRIKKIKTGQYEITFENFYAGGKEKIYVPIRGSMNTTRNINATMCISATKASEQQDYVISNEYKKYMDLTYNAKALRDYPLTATIVVLTAYTEMVEGYGTSICNPDPYAELYKLADDESFTYSTHIFNTPNAQMNNMELVIQIPKKGQKLIVQASESKQRAAYQNNTYEQEFTAIIKSISVPTGTDKNYKKYYTLDGTNWIPFDKISDISDVEKVQAIKVTADKAVNTDEVSLTFDSADASEGTIHLVTAFSYTDSNSGLEKSGYTRVVPFVITQKVKLRVPTDKIDFGEFTEAATMNDIIKAVELESIGCREVPGVKVSLIAKAEDDTPNVFKANGDFSQDVADTLNSIPADSTTYVDMNIKQQYPVGIYNAIVRVEWTDDDGDSSKDIPIHFSVVGKKDPEPNPDEPAPENPDSGDPDSGDPDPVTPDPVTPDLITPDPVAPDPITPDPTVPTINPTTPDNNVSEADIVTPSATEESQAPTKGPKTGDETPIGWLFTLCLLSAGGLLVVKKRKNK